MSIIPQPVSYTHLLFGNVPIIDAPLSPSEVKKVPQSSAREVLDNIVVPDLKMCIRDSVHRDMASVGFRNRCSSFQVIKLFP